MLHSNLVYKFKCNICNDISYGKTKHHFKVRACEHLDITPQGLIGKNSLGVSNVNMSTTRYVLGYYTLHRLLTFRSKLNINLPFCFRLQY